MVKVTRVKMMPTKNQALEVSNFFFKKKMSDPVKKTKANISNAAATINEKLAMIGESSPAEAKNF